MNLDILLSPLSPYLVAKKLEFLRNVALHLHRDLHDDDFFSAVAALIPSRAEALRLCAPAFAVDGADAWGRKPRKPDDDPVCKPATLPVSKIDFGLEIDDDDDDDCGAIFLDDCGIDSYGDERDHTEVPTGSPFSKNRSIATALRMVWRGTEGIEPLRQNVADLVAEHLEKARRAVSTRRDPVRRRVADLRKLLHLSAAETNLLVFMHLFYQEQCDWFQNLTPTPFPSPKGQSAFVRVAAATVCVSIDTVREALSGEAALMRYGLVNEDDFAISRRVVRLLSGTGRADLRSAFYRPVETELLPWDFFPRELREHGETIAALVRADRGSRGLDILLHGVAGAGKTSFACALAARLGMRAVAVAIDETEGESSNKHRDPTSGEPDLSVRRAVGF